jgi:hypothetical protein
MTVRKWGDGLLVNTPTPLSNETLSRVVGLANGGFAVVWEESDTPGDGDGFSINMQLFDAFGNKLGAERVANTTTLDDQLAPTMTVLTDGSFVVAWTDHSGADTDIRFRRFAADGTAIDTTDRIATNIAGDQEHAQLSAIPGGGFILCYEQLGDVHALRFAASGAVTGGVIDPAGIGGNGQSGADVATLQDGSFVETWVDSTPGAHQIVFQRINANGTLNGGNVNVADFPSGPSTPDVLALTNGGFLITWVDRNQPFPDTDSVAVRGQLFNASGASVGSEFTVNSFAAGREELQRTVALAGGGFAVIYAASADDTIRGQVFDAVGGRVGVEFIVNSSRA